METKKCPGILAIFSKVLVSVGKNLHRVDFALDSFPRKFRAVTEERACWKEARLAFRAGYGEGLRM